MASPGYLDDESVGGPSVLLAHLQRERASYMHRISSEEQHIDSIDSEEDDVDDDVSFTTWDSEEEARLAQEEWDESIRQLQLAVQVMLLPFVGKWLGRRWSYWGGCCSLLLSMGKTGRLISSSPQSLLASRSTASPLRSLASTGSGRQTPSCPLPPWQRCSHDERGKERKEEETICNVFLV